MRIYGDFMELDMSQKSLMELVRKAYTGELVLPDFQRNFVWTRNDIEEVIASILENVFIGTFLIQRVTKRDEPFKMIPVAGVEKINKNFNPKPEILVLDGQQRITSIFYAIYSPDIPLRNTANPYVFFVDLEQLSKENVDDAVFSYSKEWREYKKLLNSKGEYDTSKLKNEKILPLSYMSSDSDFWEIWHDSFRRVFLPQEGEKIKYYIKNFLNYKVHTLTIPYGEKVENIVSLFEKINRTGVRLSTFDLLTARFYKFLNLREEWEKAFDNKPQIRKFSNNERRKTKMAYYIVQGIALSYNHSIKARDIIRLDASVLNKENWEKATELLEDKILSRLFEVSEYGIPSGEWISYPSSISIWLGLFFKAQRRELEIDIWKINKWHWASLFLERYATSPDTNRMKDFKELVAWMEDDKNVPEIIETFRDQLKILKIRTKYSGSAKYKGVFNLLFKNGALDFFEKDRIKYSYEDLEDHHIFPKKFLELKGVDVEKDMILNRTLILSRTNRKISKKSPATYIREMIKIHGGEEAVKFLLQKHFINKRMFEILLEVDEGSPSSQIKEAFEEFITLRERLIKKELESLILSDNPYGW